MQLGKRFTGDTENFRIARGWISLVLPRENLAMLLLADDENPLWVGFKKGRMNLGAIAKELNVSEASISGWKRGNTVTAKMIDSIFARLVANFEKASTLGGKSKLPMVVGYRDAYAAGDSLIEMGKHLGYDVNTARRVIDQVYQVTQPALPNIYDDMGKTPGRAQGTLELYHGTYEVEIKRGKISLNAALQVRYVIQIGSSWAVRVKLHVPKLGRYEGVGDHNFWEYDGFIARKDNALYWTMGQRGQNSDFFYLITDTGREDGRDLVLSGTYLTTGQDDKRTIVSGTVKLTRRRAATTLEQETLMARVGVS